MCPKCGSQKPPNASACLTCGYAFGSEGSSLASSLDPSGLGVRILWIVPLLVVVAAILILVFLNVRLSQSWAYKNSVTIAKSSPELQSVLGNGIKVGWPALGYAFPSRSSEFAEWSVKLSGSRGAGHLYGVANAVNGSWEFSRLVFVAENGQTRIDLNDVSRVARLPSIPAKSVYLIPIGLLQSESIDWAPKYYKAKLGIDVLVLPQAALDPNLVDPERHQLNASKCIDFLAHLHPDLARDPSVILIGVTSRDMYIPDFDWTYAVNWRSEDRFAVVSSARLHPSPLNEQWNPEWLNSRLQKLLTKNIAMLYFDFPMSSDYTSLLSGNVFTGIQIDQMSGRLIGAGGSWNPFISSGDPGFTVYDTPGKPQLWRVDYVSRAVRDTRTQMFSTNLSLGLFIQRKMDFIFDDEYPLEFTRVYTNNDNVSRAFGIGTTHTLDMSLAGQMGSHIDLCLEDGARIHFIHQQPQPGQPDTYLEPGAWSGAYTLSKLELLGEIWRLQRNDGWTFFFDYRPLWLPQYVTVLASFTDPAGHEFKLTRNNSGDLLSITTPSGKWLHFENDDQNRIRRIESSLGRTVKYEYDQGGRLIRVVDSGGHVDTYTYDDRNQMLTAGHENDTPVVINEYSNDSYVESETLAEGGKFVFDYFRGSRNVIQESGITDPHGMLTSFLFGPGGYKQTLPTPSPH
jgi:YD repeat-containing protein